MILLLAQQSQSGFREEDYYEMLAWGIAFLFVVIGLFLLNRLLSVSFRNRIRGRHTPLAMTPEDLNKLKKMGQLTEEEAKKVRESMGRKFLERAAEEEKKRRPAGSVEVDLIAEEERVKSALQHGVQQAPKEPAESIRPEPATAPHPPLERMPPPQHTAADELPENLRTLLSLTDFELDEMQSAGFITQADLQRVRSARGTL